MNRSLSELPPSPSDELLEAYQSAREAIGAVRQMERSLTSARREAVARTQRYERMAAEALGQMRLIDVEDQDAG